MAKVIKVSKSHNGRETIYEGTLDYLLGSVFGYSLECGHSWNAKIPREPKSGKTLVKALNDSAYECRRYNDSYSLV
jgi:hypothetical protein